MPILWNSAFIIHKPLSGKGRFLLATLSLDMNMLDIVLLLPILWGLFTGFRKGLILEIFSLLALIAGIYGGIHFSDYAADLITKGREIQSDYVPIVSFIVVFLVIVVGVHLLAKALTKVASIAALGVINRIAGALFSGLKFLLVGSVAVVLLSGLNERLQLVPDEIKEDSVMYTVYTRTAFTVLPAITESRWYEQFETWREERREGTRNLPDQAGLP